MTRSPRSRGLRGACGACGPRDAAAPPGALRKFGRSLLGVSAALAAFSSSLVSCYSTGDGTDPPLDQFYFPVGLAVSHGGNVLYAVNSDFDLQYNGGTLQSYDLRAIRRDIVRTIKNPNDPALPLVRRGVPLDCSRLQDTRPDGKGRQPLGESCAPPMHSQFYVRDFAIIGAFATDLQITANTSALLPPEGTSGSAPPRTVDRLFAPVRGNASLAWADVAHDDPSMVSPEPPRGVPSLFNSFCDPGSSFRPFCIDCGTRLANRCSQNHSVGNHSDREPANTRRLTMPGEPFGLAQSADGEFLVVTHQTDTKTSLFETGMSYSGGDARRVGPSLQFVVDGVRTGGNGVAAIPMDPDAFTAATRPKAAYLQTNRAVAEVELLRQYPDESSSLRRPFLVREQGFSISVPPGGADSRGIALDPTPRLACKARVRPADPSAVPPRTEADVARDRQSCARKPLRVFVANRTPAALLVGELGSSSGKDGGDYDPDRLTLFDTIPLTAGPSRVFLAPIVDADGRYALRVFVVCFDASTLFVIEPESRRLENVIRVGAGPFAMAFDPFDLTDVAVRKEVELDPRGEPGSALRRYRFAYVASFTNSFVQALDLDNSLPSKDTFEKVVFTLGDPTLPKGVK